MDDEEHGIDFFSRLAQHEPNILRQILCYLPVQDRIRCQRINRILNQHCRWSIVHQPGVIDFTIDIFKKMNHQEIRNMLITCRDRLPGIRFYGESSNIIPPAEEKSTTIDFIRIFVEFTYPNLASLQVKWHDGGHNCDQESQYCSLLVSAIRCCPNLEVIYMENLKARYTDLSNLRNSTNLQSFTAHWHYAEPKLLVWMAERCPNLEHFHCDVSLGGGGDGARQQFSTFFQSCQQLSSFMMRDADRGGKSSVSKFLESVPQFWTLIKLRKLPCMHRVGHNFIIRLAESFPLLQEFSFVAGKDVTNDSIVALAELSDLQCLSIEGGESSISDGLIAIAKNGKLRELQLKKCVLDEFNCLNHVIRYCADLKQLRANELRIRPTVHQCFSLIMQIQLHLRPSQDLCVYFTDLESSRTHGLVDDVWNDVVVRFFAEKLKEIDENRSVTGSIGSLRL